MNHLPLSLAFFVAVLATITTAHAAPLQKDVRTRRDIQIPRSALFSESTYRFVTIAETAVHANGDAGYVESQLFITFLEGDQIRLQSAKVETCFLLFDNGEFKGGLPTENNDLFEIVNLEYNMVALRIVNPMHTQQGGSGASETSETPEMNTEMTKTEEANTEEPPVTNTEEVQTEETNTEESPVSECYLGFDSFGKPECYDSTDNRATKFTLIPLL